MVLLAAGLLLMAAGCATEEQSELSGRFGPGKGGPPVDESAVETQDLYTSGGTRFGRVSYDASYFSNSTAEAGEDTPLLLGSVVDALIVQGSTISGRPDTPCRFTAARMARDEGFDILGSGDRSNSRGVDFHQVNLRRGGTYTSVYCATLRGKVGIMLLAEGDDDLLGSRQMHYVLNSVRGAD